MAKSAIKIMDVKTETATISCLSNPITFTRYGKLVIVSYNSNSAASVASGDLGRVGTIPEGFRPANYSSVTTSQECTLKLRLIFSGNGRIDGYNYSNATSVVTMTRFPNLVYIAAD